MWNWFCGLSLLIMAMVFSGCVVGLERKGFAYSAETRAEHVQFLVDETWVDESGVRQVRQEIFDSVFEMIDEAEAFVLIDFFLVNDFLYEPGPGMRPLSRELADRLIQKRRVQPDVEVIFITDPINSVYGSIESALFAELEAAGVHVVWTNLDKLRDSNCIYSKPWRLFVKPWGVSPGKALANPMGEGRVSVRSMLKLLNFKANHRKLVVTDKSLLVTSGNPHDASSAHCNVALRVDGAGMWMGNDAEAAVLRISDAEELIAARGGSRGLDPEAGGRLELLTERKIKEKALEMLEAAAVPGRIELSMFYLADRDIVIALLKAKKRGCEVRVILDPSKDAFGRTKNGMPNRQTAARLVKKEIPLRWAATHGEQFHVKMLYVELPDHSATLLLGSGNFTRRNLDNFNAECDLAFTAPLEHEVMIRSRDTFERWWSNLNGEIHTVDYAVYEDRSLWRRFKAWMMETTGLSSF
ncbi:MAG: hypothetical protein JXR40_10525 [Pontiellaceae bacterium]|nr:hypothetical protein [Pontiellaceae bacterium]